MLHFLKSFSLGKTCMKKMLLFLEKYIQPEKKLYTIKPTCFCADFLFFFFTSNENENHGSRTQQGIPVIIWKMIKRGRIRWCSENLIACIRFLLKESGETEEKSKFRKVLLYLNTQVCSKMSVKVAACVWISSAFYLFCFILNVKIKK